MVAAADSQYYDLLDRVCTAVFTGCRRTFVLIDYQDIAEVGTANNGRVTCNPGMSVQQKCATSRHTAADSMTPT